MSGSPYRETPSGPPACKSCGAQLPPDHDSPGQTLCFACVAERYDLPVLLAMISLSAGASTGSIVFMAGGLAISSLAAYVIRRLI